MFPFPSWSWIPAVSWFCEWESYKWSESIMQESQHKILAGGQTLGRWGVGEGGILTGCGGRRGRKCNNQVRCATGLLAESIWEYDRFSYVMLGVKIFNYKSKGATESLGVLQANSLNENRSGLVMFTLNPFFQNHQFIIKLHLVNFEDTLHLWSLIGTSMLVLSWKGSSGVEVKILDFLVPDLADSLNKEQSVSQDTLTTGKE